MTQFSHSRLSTFENCPRQYEYRYIRKLPQEGEGVEAFTGKRVHEILERLYHHLERHGRPPSLSQVQDRFRKDWSLHWHDQIEIVREELSGEDFLERGERCLENYYRSHYPFDRDETVGLEQRIELDLDPSGPLAGRYRGRGIIDRLVRTAPGHYEIHDYKTGAWLPPRKRIDADRQLALYQIGIEQTYDDVENVELVWHYLLFNKTLRSRRSRDQLDELCGKTIDLLDRIAAAREFPPSRGPLCRWCDYKQVCPDAEGALGESETHATAGALPPLPDASTSALAPGARDPAPAGPMTSGLPSAAEPGAPPVPAEQLDLFS